MAKRAASSTSTTQLSSLALNDHLSKSAQQQLTALRRALESRLAALEEVLKDPGRGESLAGLILDLSRVATEEAQLAAAQACIATRADADEEIATVRASAKAALDAAQALKSTQASLDQERAVGADLRRAVEQAQLETRKQAELLKTREQLEASLRTDRDRLEAEVARQQSIVADLQRAAGDLQRAAAEAKKQLETERRSAADWQSKLEAERASGAELRQFAESASARMTSLEREQAEARAEHQATVADLARERAAAAERELADAQMHVQLESERAASADRERAYEELHAVYTEVFSQLELERAAVAELREAATHGGETSKVEEAHEEIALLQKSLAEAQDALAAAQAEFETERASMAEVRQAAEYADRQLASARSNEAQAVADHQTVAAQLDAMIKEREAVADELTAARKWINDLREAEADFALPPAPPHVEASSTTALANQEKTAAQLDAVIKERDALADELTAARKWINDLREAEAEFALPPAPPHVSPAPPPVETPSPSKAKTKAPATTTAPPKPAKAAAPIGAAGGEESWQAVRLANRYVFNTELSVQVNGNPARLFDISISGCQLLSPTALKPNQMVKIVLPETPPVTCAGKVVWTRLEPMGMGQPLGYRAGVRFTKADEVAIETFAARRATPA